jgi:hypothetical protein
MSTPFVKKIVPPFKDLTLAGPRTIRLFFKKALDFNLKKNEMPREIRKLDYIYIDVELTFEKIHGLIQNEETDQLDKLHSDEIKQMLELAQTQDEPIKFKRINTLKKLATGVADEVKAKVECVKNFKEIIANDPVFKNLSFKESMSLIKNDKKVKKKVCK